MSPTCMRRVTRQIHLHTGVAVSSGVGSGTSAAPTRGLLFGIIPLLSLTTLGTMIALATPSYARMSADPAPRASTLRVSGEMPPLLHARPSEVTGRANEHHTSDRATRPTTVRIRRGRLPKGQLAQHNPHTNEILLDYRQIYLAFSDCVDTFQSEQCVVPIGNVYFETLIGEVLGHEYYHARGVGGGAFTNSHGHIRIEYTQSVTQCDEVSQIVSSPGWRTDCASFATAMALCDYNASRRALYDTELTQATATSVAGGGFGPDGLTAYPPAGQYRASTPDDPGHNFIPRCPACEAESLDCHETGEVY